MRIGASLITLPGIDGSGADHWQSVWERDHPHIVRFAHGFRDPPMRPLGFPALLVASRDDPYADIGFARSAASVWGAGFVDVGRRGHVSGIGRWSQGKRLLEAFAAGTGHADALGAA